MNINYRVHKIVVGQLDTNCYILSEKKSKQCTIIDPGADYKRIKDLISDKGLKPLFIINTHGHADHIMANAKFYLPVHIHEKDAEFLTDPSKNFSQVIGCFINQDISPKLLHDGDKLKLGDLTIEIIHTPGHTPGGICLLYSDILFSGDTLFAQGIGRTDFPYGDEKRLINSIKTKLLVLPDSTKVYPGHGFDTTIGKEKADNPWLR